VTGLTRLLTPADSTGDVLRAMWESVRNTIDPGAVGENDGRSWTYRLIMLITTIAGIFAIGAVVAVLSSALYRRIEVVRQGRTPVVMSGHMVVLGWSNQLYTILDEVARGPDRRPYVVILSAELSKEDMEDAVRRRPKRRRTARDGALRRVRVVCRHGDPTSIEDLALVSLDTATEIIVPQPVGPKPDIRVLMTLLALNHRPWTGKKRPVAAVISSAANYAAARRALRGWPEDDFHVINAEDLTARLIVQSRRYPGLSVACAELMSFEGVELHAAPAFKAETTYGDALLRYDTASLVGFRRGGRRIINPTADTVIRASDVPLVIAWDAASISFRSRARTPNLELTNQPPASRKPRAEKTLILGWNSRITKVVQVLDGYVGDGSEVVIVGPGYDPAARPVTRQIVSIRGHKAQPTSPGVLLAADEAEEVELIDVHQEVEVPLPIDPRDFDSVVVLASEEDDRHVDADALATLLLLQAIKDRRGGEFSVVCELEEDASRRLARGIEADDLVVGHRVVSTLAVHFAKNPTRLDMVEIVTEWLDFVDSNLYFHPVADYVRLGEKVDWATVVAAAVRCGETAIGYVVDKSRRDEDQNYGVFLNPAKKDVRAYQEADQLIVIAGRAEVVPS
jgi:hypothetical protein